jgi:superfamily II DNA or RNA helicase
MDFNALSARVKAQKAAKDAIRESGYNCSIISSVGTGKSKIMIDLAEELLQAKKIKTVLYLCDNRRLRDSDEDGFPAELKKWGSDELKRAVRRECYQTAYKWVGQHYDLLLGDEMDMAITPEYVKAFLNNKCKYKILVSGTLSTPKAKVLSKIAPIVYQLRSYEAENKGVVNKTEYYTYNFKLSDEECKEYNKLTAKITQLTKIQTPIDDPQLQFWMRSRKHFLNTLESSARHCRKIIAHLEKKNNNRIVIFCERTEQADKVCEFSFHGQNEQDDMLTRFQEGEINKIAVVAKVKRGINLKNVNIGIFESLSGSSTEWEQRSGRLKRLKTSEVACVIFLIPWIKSVDQDGDEIYKTSVVQRWVTRATENIPNINFKIFKL